MATPGEYTNRTPGTRPRLPITLAIDHEEAEESVGSKQDKQGQHHVVGGMLCSGSYVRGKLRFRR